MEFDWATAILITFGVIVVAIVWMHYFEKIPVLMLPGYFEIESVLTEAQRQNAWRKGVTRYQYRKWKHKYFRVGQS